MTLCQEIWTVNDIQSARIVEQIGTKNMTGLKKLTQARICLIYDRILRKKSRQTRILIPLYLPMAVVFVDKQQTPSVTVPIPSI